jgi:hypothetical protein
MDQRQPATPHDAPAGRWLAENAGILFSAVRRVVADSLCASDLAPALLHLDEDAGDALAAMERGAPSPGALAGLRPSAHVRRSTSDVRQDS